MNLPTKSSLLPPRFRHVAALIAVAGISSLAACGDKPVSEPVRPTPVKLEKAQTTETPSRYEFSAEIQPRYESSLGFRVPGKVAHRLVNLGDTVQPGTVLASLDPRDLLLAADAAQANLQQAQAQLGLAADEVTRYRDLHARDLVAKAELERREAAWTTAKAQVDALSAQLRQARNAAEYGTLQADAAGVVTAVFAEAGQVLSAGQPVLRLARSGEIEAQIDVPETVVNRLQVGSSAVVSIPGVTRSIDGKVREIAAAADPATRTYRVRVALPAASDVRLGMSARVAFMAVSAAKPPAGVSAKVPLAAVADQGGKTYVWVVGDDGKAVARDVRMQQVDGADWVIVQGVRPGESVVAAGASFLRPGEVVAPVNTSANNGNGRSPV